jgi:transposase
MLTSAEVRGKWVLSVEDWAEIRRLHRAERMPIKVIARVLGCSKNTVKKALVADQPPTYRRQSRGSVVDSVEPRIRELLQVCPTMPATVIAERIEWGYSIRTLSGRVAELRPIYLPPDPASRTTYLAGEIAQCDFWFPPITLPVGFGQIRSATRLPVLTMITGYARWGLAMLLPARRAEDLYAGWWQLLQQLGAVPRVLVWDGEAAVGRWRARQPLLTTACQGFRGVLGAKVLICKPADPEAKGGIERLHRYLETSFLPGRSFTSPLDFNTQLQAWLGIANRRRKRSLGCAPADRIAADRAAMLALPVHPSAVGRRVLVRADLDRVRVWCEGDVAADHERVWARHQTISDPSHVRAAEALRQQRFTVVRPVNETEVAQRRLTDYDTALGVAGFDGGVAL